MAQQTSKARIPVIEGVPPELAARFPEFVRMGVDLQVLTQAVREAGSLANAVWSKAMSAFGEQAWVRAEAAARYENFIVAQRCFLTASFWFFLARFPHILNERASHAYRRHGEAYARAAKFFRDPMVRVEIPARDGNFPALLRLPRDATDPVPLVLITGGLDTWKSDPEIHFQVEDILQRGIATLAIDIAGTGEAPVPLGPGAEELHRAALEWARQDARIDGTRLGAYGVGFGGYFAAKLALTDPSLKGVVQVRGPLHFAFSVENLTRLPRSTLVTLARGAGLDYGRDAARVLALLSSMSLSCQGLLPAQEHAPLLSINGGQDELVSIRDLRWLSEQGVHQDMLTEDRLHGPLAAAWLAGKLTTGGVSKDPLRATRVDVTHSLRAGSANACPPSRARLRYVSKSCFV